MTPHIIAIVIDLHMKLWCVMYDNEGTEDPPINILVVRRAYELIIPIIQHSDFLFI